MGGRAWCSTEGRVPPRAADAERAVLGAAMVERDAFGRVAGIVTAECFYEPAHQEVFRAMEELDREGRPVDLLTVAERTAGSEAVRSAGGAAYLSRLTSLVAGAANVEAHARIVREKHVARTVIEACGRVAAMAYEEGRDVEEAVAELNRAADAANEEAAGSGAARDLRRLVGECLGMYEKRAENARKGARNGIPTGLAGLDGLTGGWKGGQLVVVGARPGMGKTAMALHMAKAAAMAGVASCFYSLEMDDVSLTDRLLLSESGVDKRRFRDGTLTEEEARRLHEAAGRLEGLPVYIDDRAGATMEYVRNHARTMRRRGRCGLIVVDYLQLTGSAATGRGWNREQEVAAVSRAAKMTAKELGVPFILLSQLNRKAEERKDKVPELADLRESGAIEQDADVICLLYRPEAYGIDDVAVRNVKVATKGVGVVIVAKQRDGETGKVFFRYDEAMTRFSDFGARWGEERPF